MLASYQGSAEQILPWLRVVEASFGAFQSLITGVGIIIGGVFAYYRFFKEETHKSRLQPSISGVVGTKDSTIYLQARVVAENTGRTSVSLGRGATALQVSTRENGDKDWTLRATERVFTIQGYVQPGETIIDQVWMEITDNGEVAIRLELVLLASENVGWLATEVVNLVAQRDNDHPESERS